MLAEPSTVATGFLFLEGPRWFDGRLWVSDMTARQVLTVEPGGRVTVAAKFEDEPSGIGFLPDGSPVVVSRRSRTVVRLLPGGGQEVHADLTGIPCDSLNDMVVDEEGRAYVDAVYHRASPGPEDIGDAVVVVDKAGTIIDVAHGVVTPNGLAVAPDGRSLIVAETFGRRLTSFSRSSDGMLGAPTGFADLGEASPDGICVDEDGNVWVASPFTSEFLHVERGGRILGRIPVGGLWAVACALGGEAGRTLFLVVADTDLQSYRDPARTSSYVAAVEVAVPAVSAA